jgi:hypothetical protein
MERAAGSVGGVLTESGAILDGRGALMVGRKELKPCEMSLLFGDKVDHGISAREGLSESIRPSRPAAGC